MCEKIELGGKYMILRIKQFLILLYDIEVYKIYFKFFSDYNNGLLKYL